MKVKVEVYLKYDDNKPHDDNIGFYAFLDGDVELKDKKLKKLFDAARTKVLHDVRQHEEKAEPFRKECLAGEYKWISIGYELSSNAEGVIVITPFREEWPAQEASDPGLLRR